MSYEHISVLGPEAVEYLALRPNGIYVDATFGGGGHTRRLLEADPTITVIAFDWDKEAIDQNGPALQELFGDRLILIWSNFAKISYHLKRLKIAAVDGILADFGTSRYQIETGEGFSCTRDTPLDMRMSPAHGQKTAADILANSSEHELVDIIGMYGGERFAKRIARAIVTDRVKKPLRTTGELAGLIERIIPEYDGRIHPATRTFQALRIVVNRELENIHALLEQAPHCIHAGGRMVCISFHSLEDRLVKRAFADHPSTWEIIGRQGIVPSDVEIAANPASRSARLRVAKRK